MYEINIPLPTPSDFHVGNCFPEIKKKRKEKKTLKDTGHRETRKTGPCTCHPPEILMECYCTASRKPIRDEKSTFVNHKHMKV